MSLFERGDDDGDDVVLEVRLNARLGPVQRGDRYEDPLAYFLEARFPGSVVTGGGTLLSTLGEPLSCRVDAHIVGDPADVLEATVGFLDDVGAPRGSTARVDRLPEREFGTTDGVAVYLNGKDLSDEVYATHDVNELLDDLQDSLGDTGGLQSYWEGPDDTAVYLYGPSAELMLIRVSDLLAKHPLAQMSRVEPIT